MLPVKIYPSYIPKHNLKKMMFTLKAHCRLPDTLRCKWFKVTFLVPTKVNKVSFSNVEPILNTSIPADKQPSANPNSMMTYDNLSNVYTHLYEIASSSLNGTTMTSLPDKHINGQADYDHNKRKVEWLV